MEGPRGVKQDQDGNAETMRVVLVGPSGCGKTSLLSRWIDGKFTPESHPTNGAAGRVKFADVKGVKLKMRVHDASGAVRHRRIVEECLTTTHACILCFESDISTLKPWVEVLNKIGNQASLKIIVQCKVDDEKAESAKSTGDSYWKGSTFLKDIKDILPLKTSALTGYNVDEVFSLVAARVLSLKIISVKRKLKKRLKLTSRQRRLNSRTMIKPSVIIQPPASDEALLSGSRAFKKGMAVKYKSVSAGGWIDTVVVSVQPDGRVDLLCRPGADPNRIRIIDLEERRRNIECRKHWTTGDLIEVYSVSANKWIPTEILSLTKKKSGFLVHTALKDLMLDSDQLRGATVSIPDRARSPEAKVWKNGSNSQLKRPLANRGSACTVLRPQSADGGRVRNPQVRFKSDTIKTLQMDKVHTYKFDDLRRGQQVRYYSETASAWISAVVLSLNVDGTVNLDVKEGAIRSKIRTLDHQVLRSPVAGSRATSPTITHARTIGDPEDDNETTQSVDTRQFVKSRFVHKYASSDSNLLSKAFRKQISESTLPSREVSETSIKEGDPIQIGTICETSVSAPNLRNIPHESELSFPTIDQVPEEKSDVGEDAEIESLRTQHTKRKYRLSQVVRLLEEMKATTDEIKKQEEEKEKTLKGRIDYLQKEVISAKHRLDEKKRQIRLLREESVQLSGELDRNTSTSGELGRSKEVRTRGYYSGCTIRCATM
ncbi:hypothetical protein AAMO2058_000039400 [Amorphochlora amoebiformis]